MFEGFVDGRWTLDARQKLVQTAHLKKCQDAIPYCKSSVNVLSTKIHVLLTKQQLSNKELTYSRAINISCTK
jgi:hypothetical protein